MLGTDFADVISAAHGGDEVAFARLWRDTHPALLRYLRVTAPDIADDAASETWLQVTRSLGSFAGDEAGFRSWLFTIARSKVVDDRRRTARRPVMLADGSDLLDRPADDDVPTSAMESLSTRWALEVIATLPPEQAEVVLLRVLAGLDVASVARIVGRSPGAVRVAQHRALRRLAGRLAGVPSGGVTG